MPKPASGAAPGPRLAWRLLAVLLFPGFCALGTWQVQRRAWKLDLIAPRGAAGPCPAVPAPGPPRWPGVSADADECRHVSLTGRYDYGKEALTQASTELGSGYWVITPLRRDDGSTVLINRGFVPATSVPASPIPLPPAMGNRHWPAARHRTGRRFPSPQRSRRQSLVFPRCAGHRGGARPVRYRALLLSTPRPRRAHRRMPGPRRHDRRRLSQQPPGLCHYVVRPGPDGGRRRSPLSATNAACAGPRQRQR